MRYDAYQNDFLPRQQAAQQQAMQARQMQQLRPSLTERAGWALIGVGERLLKTAPTAPEPHPQMLTLKGRS